MSEGVHKFFSHAHKSSTGWKKGTKGYYKICFTEKLDRVTDKDLLSRVGYAKDYLSNYLHTDKKLISVSLKKESQTLTTNSEVYYVIVGKVILGKMSISIQRAFRWTSMTFIYQSKNQARKKRVNKGEYVNTNHYNRMKERKHLHDERKRDS